ncbi:MAG: adenylate/guanylate cyclase domain-containing protein [Hyphomicrobiales bacterium]
MSSVARTEQMIPIQNTSANLAERFALQALEKNKRESLRLAVYARWAALALIAVMLPFLNPNWDVLYYHGMLALFALLGWAQLRAGRVGVSRIELFLMFLDLALITIVCVVPNPFNPNDWPATIVYKFGNFIYFFIFLAAGMLAYSWRTVVAIGTWTAGLWTVGVIYVWLQPITHPELGAAIAQVVGGDERLFRILNPNAIDFGQRIQEIVIFLIVACTLALASRRASHLFLDHVSSEQQRANLSRYFSPKVAEELAHNNEPLKQVRTQNVAVLFVDMVGFTAYADGKSPEDVIATLREFHGRMETQVFNHSGTLDKYLGDGLMATFGTPFAGEHDATNALNCVEAMMSEIIDLNIQRKSAGELPIKASFGLHYGPVVLGDIGAQRLEFAVIGTTVNVAARLEALTRKLECTLITSDDFMHRVREQENHQPNAPDSYTFHAKQHIRGITHPLSVWSR